MDAKIFVLVVSMWGHNGTEWEYIGNQSVLNQDMTQQQCEYMADEEKTWTVHNTNKYYRIQMQCYPKKCAGQKTCE
jgi:hypothetical protein|tara:strand:- start:254 stop:481 length:228 start_codon:yes stop_codon:yes gene_type:complete